ncbi:hypothetical protein F444_06967, partial [Phytophthora nicotianae P1976]
MRARFVLYCVLGLPRGKPLTIASSARSQKRRPVKQEKKTAKTAAVMSLREGLVAKSTCVKKCVSMIPTVPRIQLPSAKFGMISGELEPTYLPVPRVFVFEHRQ